MGVYRKDGINQGARIGRIELEVDSNKVITDAKAVSTDAAIALKLDANGGVFIVPTSDPAVANALWNNSGTLSISAG